MSEVPSIKIVDIPLYPYSIPTFVDHASSIINSSKENSANYCVSATGAHGMVYAQKNPAFKKLLQSFYSNLPDGKPGVWVGRFKGATEMERCYGPDFFASCMKESADKDIKHFFCGGKEGVANKLKKACEKRFSNHNIVGTYCPPFLGVDEFDYKQIAEAINQSKADVVWIGISTPKQEQFAWRLSKFTNVSFLITVGAAFDFHIGNVRQAPSWMQSMGLEWFFRLLMEPRRLYKRYMEIVPAFLYYSAVDLWNYNFKNKK
jgi:N-acetylglucosaminyldiphosphoundecaprenol N-acetyl-beta-D-mannosaminyltransferase